VRRGRFMRRERKGFYYYRSADDSCAPVIINLFFNFAFSSPHFLISPPSSALG
jgi:hypothetical protein